MITQITKIQRNTFCIKINNRTYYYVPPKYLADDKIVQIPVKVKGSTLGWYVNREFVSYNQLKKAICKPL